MNHSLPETGETPLHAALCKANRPAYDLVLEVLPASRADPNRTTRAGAETGSFMRGCRTRGETPLHRAAAFGTAGAIRLLLEAGAIVDARDANGETPLCRAGWHLRPGSILQVLCYGGHWISSDAIRHSTGDHGTGWGGLEASLRGKPHA